MVRRKTARSCHKFSAKIW